MWSREKNNAVWIAIERLDAATLRVPSQDALWRIVRKHMRTEYKLAKLDTSDLPEKRGSYGSEGILEV